MIVDPDFIDHWKTRLLARLLRTDAAPVYVIRFWAHCQTRKAWTFQGWDPDILASVCRWEGDSGTFWDAMLQTFCRLEGDTLVAHGWEKSNASLIASWKNGPKGGRPPRSTTTPPPPPPPPPQTEEKPATNPPVPMTLALDEPAGNPRVTTSTNPAVNPPETHGGTDKRREEKSREEEKEPPTPWTVEGVELPEPMRSEEWKKPIETWLSYKREKRQSYKPRGLAVAMEQWGKTFTPEEFAAAVDRSIANSWSGLFQHQQHRQNTPAVGRYSTATRPDAAF